MEESMNAKEIIKEFTEKIQKNATAKAVFGEPVEKGKITVIPVATISIRGCGGGGLDNRKDGDSDSKTKAGGMGLGINAKAVPAGFIEIDGENARFVEIVQQSKIVMAGIALGAFAVFSLTRMIKKIFG
jgi:uncharacterized spore protein YtfJ